MNAKVNSSRGPRKPSVLAPSSRLLEISPGSHQLEMQLVHPARPLQPWADGNRDCDASRKSTTVRPEPPTTLPYPPGKYPSSRLHAHQASRPGNSSDVPSAGRENCVDPSKRHPPDFHHHHWPPPARAYLHDIFCLQIRTTGVTCPSSLTTLSTSRCPPPEPQSSSCAQRAEPYL